jgi:hypothetical protein
MKKNTSLQAILCGLALLLIHANASAQMVTPENISAPVVVDSIPSDVGPAGTTGSDGYVLFNYQLQVYPYTTADLTNLPGYVDSSNFTENGTENVVGTPPNLTVGKASYQPGDLFGDGSPASSGVAAVPFDFATMELTANVPAAFDVGVLYNYPDYNVYTLSLYSGVPSDANLVSSAVLNDGTLNYNYSTGKTQNEFYYGEVTGATAGDYLVVSGVSLNGFNDETTLSGITFDTVTPEPSTYALMLTGLGLLILVARFRRSPSEDNS